MRLVQYTCDVCGTLEDEGKLFYASLRSPDGTQEVRKEVCTVCVDRVFDALRPPLKKGRGS